MASNRLFLSLTLLGMAALLQAAPPPGETKSPHPNADVEGSGAALGFVRAAGAPGAEAAAWTEDHETVKQRLLSQVLGGAAPIDVASQDAVAAACRRGLDGPAGVVRRKRGAAA